MNVRMRLAAPLIVLGILSAFSVSVPASAAGRDAKSVYFSNEDQLPVTLSSTNPNKIIIDGELITNIYGPGNAYEGQNTEDGALMIALNSASAFTLYIQTDRGSSVSLSVTAVSGPGRTYELIPRSLPKVDNEDAKAWEEGQPYVNTLLSIAQAVVNGDVPPDFVEYPVSRADVYSPSIGLQFTAEKQWIGSHLRVTRYRMKNLSNLSMNFKERQFYVPGVRGITLSTQSLFPGGQGYVWVISRFNGESK
ncbi:conjugal transfer protein TraK [Serratia ficaria]|uniref:type-F conjugative transfer system secretin TraK n=1 Tax=Serratia ficaria TaxID=61651 RepID=UPI002183A5E1|nr:type-F conjugative transfer system secretin TraK [Serratia ficaria]CAI2533855.1 conjugal transfer protein TraK [Serratia ficaria]